MTIGSLFSGIGGLEVALEWAGLGPTLWHAEINKPASQILHRHWPDAPNLGSVPDVDWSHVQPVEVLCGGFPCQPFSSAGLKKGVEDERFMWPGFERAPEWMMGYPVGWTEGIARTNRIKCVGNAVCPQAALYALLQLLERL